MSRFGPGVLPWADVEGPEVSDVIAQGLRAIEERRRSLRDEERRIQLAGGELVGVPERQGGIFGFLKPRKVRRILPEYEEQQPVQPTAAQPRAPSGGITLPRPMFDEEPVVGRAPRLALPRQQPVAGMVPSQPTEEEGVQPPLPLDRRIIEGELYDLNDPAIAAAIEARGRAATEGMGSPYTELTSESGKVFRLPRPGVREARTAAEQAERARYSGLISGAVEHERDLELEGAKAETRAAEQLAQRAFSAEQAEADRQARADLADEDWDNRFELNRRQHQQALAEIEKRATSGGNVTSQDRLIISTMMQGAQIQMSRLEAERRDLTDWDADPILQADLNAARDKQKKGRGLSDREQEVLDRYEREQRTRSRIEQEMEMQRGVVRNGQALLAGSLGVTLAGTEEGGAATSWEAIVDEVLGEAEWGSRPREEILEEARRRQAERGG